MSKKNTRPVARTLPEFVFHLHVSEVIHLLDIAADQKRRRDAEVIHRAAIVFIAAVWQTYVEALADNLAGSAHPRDTRLSTPDARKIDEHFRSRFGIDAISQSWRWRGMSVGASRRRLRDLLDLRHEIAHKARLRKPLRKHTVLQYAHFTHRLAVCMQNAVGRHRAWMFGASYRPTRYDGKLGYFIAPAIDA